jgi:GT2 family glycosyltransferase
MVDVSGLLPESRAVPLSVHGRFFHHNEKRLFLRAVTYGPFPPENPPDHSKELRRIAAAGFNAVRTYELPTEQFLDELSAHDLVLLAAIPWHWDSLFCENHETVREARKALTNFLVENGRHSALGALLIANEIRPDLVRFMGPLKVRAVLEELIAHCHHLVPELPCAYANFPTTEYLEPRNADFTAFNVYLEHQEDFTKYLRRLHNVAGDRPLLLTEFGLDTSREHAKTENPEAEQARTLSWGLQTAQAEAAAGFTVYAWSDRWFNGGREVKDWSFGLTRRDGSEKPALQELTAIPSFGWPQPKDVSKISIALCTRNGAERLADNLPTFETIEDHNFELLIVDDGSEDNTIEIVQRFLKSTSLNARLLTQPPGGLSVARNLATQEAQGEVIAYIDDDARPHPLWLHYLRVAFARNPDAGAAGGPNLAPEPHSLQSALISASSGNASHVLLDDTTAEHLPGCNLAVRRDLLREAEGFDPQFHTAGDDVDLCWRLLDAGYELAFHPAACVFHDRRPDVTSFLRQQRGYGHAEALLSLKHPERFHITGIRWQGVVYTGEPLSVHAEAVIYHGPMGEAPFQPLQLRAMPRRALAERWDRPLNRKALFLLHQVACYYRRRSREKLGSLKSPRRNQPHRYIDHLETTTRRDYQTSRPNPRQGILAILQQRGWTVSRNEAEVDLEKGPLKVILAQTPQQVDCTKLHVKVSHPPVSLEAFWKEFEIALEEEKSQE